MVQSATKHNSKVQRLAIGCLAILFSCNAWPARSKGPLLADKPIGMVCVTEFPTTSFMVTTEGDRLRVQVLHHNGVRYMPIWDGITTPEDLTSLQKASTVLQQLGDNIVFNWKTSGCNVENDLLFQCVGEAEDFEINGLKVHPWSLSVSEVNEHTLWGDFFHRNLTLNLSIAEQNYRISMNYGAKECVRSDLAIDRP